MDNKPVQFRSILSAENCYSDANQVGRAPSFFHDLNLEGLVAAICDKWQEYNLLPFYYNLPDDLELITYRQDVMKDIENPCVMQAVKSFSRKIKQMRDLFPREGEYYYVYQKERMFLDSVEAYCKAVEEFYRELQGLELKSHGLLTFRDYLNNYTESDYFKKLKTETDELNSRLYAINYCLLIKGGSITVYPYTPQKDYSAAIEETFEKFSSGSAKSYQLRNFQTGGMNHIQAQIIERVARLYPEVFISLEKFYAEHTNYLDETIARFDREIQFFVSYLSYIEKFKNAGLSFCYPRLGRQSKEVSGAGAFDIALADKLIDLKREVVKNDFFLRGAERIFVVSGPNHGGKTTFARMFGQLHYFARLGCPVPGSESQLFLFDRLFTHFERQERIESLRGKLKDDLFRIRQILDQATPNSIIIINEIFSSTTLQDAVYLGRKIIEKISALDLLCVCVTFLDELSSYNEKTVSVVSTVDPNDLSVRTFKLVRKPADGLAYALAIAERHHVTYKWLMERIKE